MFLTLECSALEFQWPTVGLNNITRVHYTLVSVDHGGFRMHHSILCIEFPINPLFIFTFRYSYCMAQNYGFLYRCVIRYFQALINIPQPMSSCDKALGIDMHKMPKRGKTTALSVHAVSLDADSLLFSPTPCRMTLAARLCVTVLCTFNASHTLMRIAWPHVQCQVLRER